MAYSGISCFNRFIGNIPISEHCKEYSDIGIKKSPYSLQGVCHLTLPVVRTNNSKK